MGDADFVSGDLEGLRTMVPGNIGGTMTVGAYLSRDLFPICYCFFKRRTIGSFRFFKYNEKDSIEVLILPSGMKKCILVGGINPVMVINNSYQVMTAEGELVHAFAEITYDNDAKSVLQLTGISDVIGLFNRWIGCPLYTASELSQIKSEESERLKQEEDIKLKRLKDVDDLIKKQAEERRTADIMAATKKREAEDAKKRKEELERQYTPLTSDSINKAILSYFSIAHVSTVYPGFSSDCVRQKFDTYRSVDHANFFIDLNPSSFFSPVYPSETVVNIRNIWTFPWSEMSNSIPDPNPAKFTIGDHDIIQDLSIGEFETIQQLNRCLEYLFPVDSESQRSIRNINDQNVKQKMIEDLRRECLLELKHTLNNYVQTELNLMTAAFQKKQTTYVDRQGRKITGSVENAYTEYGLSIEPEILRAFKALSQKRGIYAKMDDIVERMITLQL